MKVDPSPLVNAFKDSLARSPFKKCEVVVVERDDGTATVIVSAYDSFGFGLGYKVDVVGVVTKEGAAAEVLLFVRHVARVTLQRILDPGSVKAGVWKVGP